MAAGYAWFLVLGSVFLCNLMKTLLPSISSFVSRGYCFSVLCLLPSRCVLPLFVGSVCAVLVAQSIVD